MLGWRTGPSPRAWGLLHQSASDARHSGPSPRAWGLHSPLSLAPQRQRSIPTCVGTTVAAVGEVEHHMVHPHVRGDYGASSGPERALSGPSPRAWGLRYFRPAMVVVARSIPTCVGTTLYLSRGAEGPAVHPHVRGDYDLLNGPRPALGGPSPRAWGLHMTRTAKTSFAPLLRVFYRIYSKQYPEFGFGLSRSALATWPVGLRRRNSKPLPLRIPYP